MESSLCPACPRLHVLSISMFAFAGLLPRKAGWTEACRWSGELMPCAVSKPRPPAPFREPAVPAGIFRTQAHPGLAGRSSSQGPVHVSASSRRELLSHSVLPAAIPLQWECGRKALWLALESLCLFMLISINPATCEQRALCVSRM